MRFTTLIATLTISFFSHQLSAQQSFLDQSDVKFGVGYVLLGTGDYLAPTFQTEFTNQWHRLFSSSIALHTGHAEGSFFSQNTFFAGDANIFISPFGNTGKHNFKLGTGLTYAYTNYQYMSSGTYINNELIEMEFSFNRENTWGYILQIGHEYLLNERVLLGVEASMHRYNSGYQILGGSAMIGFRL